MGANESIIIDILLRIEIEQKKQTTVLQQQVELLKSIKSGIDISNGGSGF